MIQNFIYPKINDTDRTFAGVPSPIIMPSGSWLEFLPLDELQGKNNVEPSSCYIEAQQCCIATLMEAMYGIKDSNFSARFNALLSGGTQQGGDPLKGAYSINHDGLIPQEMMDWQDIHSWQDFHSWLDVDKEKCLFEGKNFLNQWELSYKIVFEKDVPLKTKYELLKEALKRSPVAVSVYAWVENNSVYYKPEGASDTHLVMVAVSMNDKGQIIIRDTYYPYLKTLDKDFNFDFAMSWAIRKKNPEEQLNGIQKNFIIILYQYVAKLFKQIRSTGSEIVGAIFSKKS